MSYEKPEVCILGDAVLLIHGSDKEVNADSTTGQPAWSGDCELSD